MSTSSSAQLHQSSVRPTTIQTERLVLHLADPLSEADCEEILRSYNDQQKDEGLTAKIPVDTIAAIRKKHRIHGPKAQYCTLASPPRGMYFLVYLREPIACEQDGHTSPIGMFSMCFRAEMPYPDLGYGILGPYQGNGYATEAGRNVVAFWRDTVGVKQICVMTQKIM